MKEEKDTKLFWQWEMLDYMQVAQRAVSSMEHSSQTDGDQSKQDVENPVSRTWLTEKAKRKGKKEKEKKEKEKIRSKTKVHHWRGDPQQC